MSAWFAIVTGHSEWCVLLCLREIPTHACVISHLWPNTSAYAEFRLFSSEMFKYILPLVHLLCPRWQKYPCCRARQTDVEAGVDACILCQSGGSYRPCPSLQHCLIRSVCIWPSHRCCWCLIMQQARPHTLITLLTPTNIISCLPSRRYTHKHTNTLNEAEEKCLSWIEREG